MYNSPLGNGLAFVIIIMRQKSIVFGIGFNFKNLQLDLGIGS